LQKERNCFLGSSWRDNLATFHQQLQKERNCFLGSRAGQPHAKTNSMALARKLSKEARSPFLKSKILKNKRVTKSSGLAAKAKTEGKHLREFHLRW